MPRDYDEGHKAGRLLAVGFLLIILLLCADGFAVFQSVRSVRMAASELAEDQIVQMALIDEVQREQGSLSAIFYRLKGDPNSLDRGKILRQIDATEQNIHRIVAAGPVDSSERQTWDQLFKAAAAFSAEARRLLSLEDLPELHSRELLRSHDEVVAAVTQLIRASHRKAHHAKEEIDVLSEGQVRRDAVLLGSSIVLAFVCAFTVLRTSSRMYLMMTQQSEELSRVSWQLLENQEVVARRLSHELHDELGQTLTALKMNFTTHSNSPCADPVWMRDCSRLLKDSIRSAHEISQLLRPTILDDFGLDSALSWLCERFSERSGMDVECSVRFKGRLSVEIETHLFRIAQEALTNVARHSGAARVDLQLREDQGRLYLQVKDNGRGLPSPDQVRKGASGLSGMRARARSCGGELKIRSGPEQGVTIEVRVPLEARKDEAKDTHLVG